jgi:Cytochrome c554 and c-prime
VRNFVILGFYCALTFSAPSVAQDQAAPCDLVNRLGGRQTGVGGDQRCSTCHEQTYNSYLQTAHHLTSRLPTKGSIMGPFSLGKNTMSTFNPQLSFLMEARDGRFYQTALTRKSGQLLRRTEEIDIVIGSATRGQTYLYWEENHLYELPVSYWTELGRWVNSPGYVDGSADFDRPVPPRCIECHATFFQPLSPSPTSNEYDARNFVLGISCERCHGSGDQHMKDRASNPSATATSSALPPIGLSRDREIDVCAQCHGGAGNVVAPPFSFQPGQLLSDYILLRQPSPTEPVDVHGNQVALLERSRCFRSSPNMSCSTCHDVHSREKPAASYSAVCLKCHNEKNCGAFAKLGSQIAQNCIDCHMPVQASNLLTVDTDDTRLPANVRNHWIRVYSKSTLP